MKKTILIISCSVLLSSCCSKNDIIKNYLYQETKNEIDEKIILIKEKKTFDEAFHIFHRTSIFPETDEQKATYEEVKKKYSSENIGFWSKKDFKKIFFKLVSIDSLSNYTHEIERDNYNNSSKLNYSYVYFLSNPYFYNNNKNVFYNIKKCYFGTYRSYIYDDVIIMKKEKGRWIIEDKIGNSNL